MVCTGHTNSCPAHPGYDPPLSPVSWTDDPLDTTDDVKATHFNELKYYVDVEFTRRGLSPSAGFPPDNMDTEDIIYASDYREIRDHLRTASFSTAAGTWDTSIPSACGYGSMARGRQVSGVPANLGYILDETTEEMRTEIDLLRAECLCDCNYSCTCNCNYCVCNCNHACQCNCNYISDERLKMEIKPLPFGLDLIRELKPIIHKWKAPRNDGKQHFGFIAQEVDSSLPMKLFGIVKTHHSYYTVDYTQFIPALTKACQQLDDSDIAINQRLKELEEKLKELEEQNGKVSTNSS